MNHTKSDDKKKIETKKNNLFAMPVHRNMYSTIR